MHRFHFAWWVGSYSARLTQPFNLDQPPIFRPWLALGRGGEAMALRDGAAHDDGSVYDDATSCKFLPFCHTAILNNFLRYCIHHSAAVVRNQNSYRRYTPAERVTTGTNGAPIQLRGSRKSAYNLQILKICRKMKNLRFSVLGGAQIFCRYFKQGLNS